jgi:hypothetical protein
MFRPIVVVAGELPARRRPACLKLLFVFALAPLNAIEAIAL